LEKEVSEMALVFVRAVLPATRRSESKDFRVARQVVNIFSFTKAGGDVAGNLDTKLQYCTEVVVLDADGVTVIAATFTTGSGAPGTFTTALAALGGGTAGFVICFGNNVRH
jgi:hypothetical protein